MEHETFTPFPHYENRVSLFEKLPVKKASIVFLGDSITQRNEWAEMFGNPLIVNRGIDSDRVEGVLQRLPAILAGQPAKLFLLIGINDIADKKPTEAIISSYKKIVTLVRTQSPQTELYLQSVLPVNHTPYNHYIDNRDVEALNRQIARLADGENSHFVPLHEAFLADNKTELAEQFTYDGVHLSGEGYLTWKQLVEPYLLQISTDK